MMSDLSISLALIEIFWSQLTIRNGFIKDMVSSNEQDAGNGRDSSL
jgi:hypothetical protein